jgi:hypothetical protein
LHGEVERGQLSLLRSRASARALADALTAAGARRREDNLRLAVWSLEGGGSFQPDIMYSAAMTARQRYDFPLAERLARAAVGAGAGFEAGLLLAQVCWLQGSVEAPSFFSFFLGWLALAEGRVLTAAHLAGESAGAFRDMAWPLWVRNALAIRAHALALRHDVETARTVLCDLDALGVPPSEISGPEVPRARAWTRAWRTSQVYSADFSTNRFVPDRSTRTSIHRSRRSLRCVTRA